MSSETSKLSQLFGDELHKKDGAKISPDNIAAKHIGEY